ncbi:hypothetical protein VTJ04DRAFT_4164 [Mycothermus thermophilus]|uniref:uncharacterized protein n=1 Tax=Humicola insolens TaxID=85995 RepID=UPI003742F754
MPGWPKARCRERPVMSEEEREKKKTRPEATPGVEKQRAGVCFGGLGNDEEVRNGGVFYREKMQKMEDERPAVTEEEGGEEGGMGRFGGRHGGGMGKKKNRADLDPPGSDGRRRETRAGLGGGGSSGRNGGKGKVEGEDQTSADRLMVPPGGERKWVRVRPESEGEGSDPPEPSFPPCRPWPPCLARNLPERAVRAANGRDKNHVHGPCLIGTQRFRQPPTVFTVRAPVGRWAGLAIRCKETWKDLRHSDAPEVTEDRRTA